MPVTPGLGGSGSGILPTMRRNSVQYRIQHIEINAVFSDRTVQDVANTLTRCVVLPTIRRTRGTWQPSSHPERSELRAIGPSRQNSEIFTLGGPHDTAL